MEQKGFIDKLVGLIDNFDISVLLPEIGTFMGWAAALCRLCILLGPLVMLGLGLVYLFKPPKEAGKKLGYRCRAALGSAEAWRFTQQIAGLAFTVLGGLLSLAMLIVCFTFSASNPYSMAETTIICMIIELVLISLCCIGVNIWIGRSYDKDGNRKS